MKSYTTSTPFLEVSPERKKSSSSPPHAAPGASGDKSWEELPVNQMSWGLSEEGEDFTDPGVLDPSSYSSATSFVSVREGAASPSRGLSSSVKETLLDVERRSYG
jgi:hypothetical protein